MLLLDEAQSLFLFLKNQQFITQNVVVDCFFFNQQFITRSARADHGRHKVSTYMETGPTCEQKRREREKRKRKEY